VPIIVSVQPSASGTSARFVPSVTEPPSLVITDGTTTLVFIPASTNGGLAAAAEFAEALVQVVSEWEAGCRMTLAAAEPGNPWPDLEALTADYGPLHHDDGESPT
jgi:hypothetical protein